MVPRLGIAPAGLKVRSEFDRLKALGEARVPLNTAHFKRFYETLAEYGKRQNELDVAGYIRGSTVASLELEPRAHFTVNHVMERRRGDRILTPERVTVLHLVRGDGVLELRGAKGWNISRDIVDTASADPEMLQQSFGQILELLSKNLKKVR